VPFHSGHMGKHFCAEGFSALVIRPRTVRNLKRERSSSSLMVVAEHSSESLAPLNESVDIAIGGEGPPYPIPSLQSMSTGSG